MPILTAIVVGSVAVAVSGLIVGRLVMAPRLVCQPWHMTPRILVTYEAPVSLEDVRRAAALWHAHGAPKMEVDRFRGNSRRGPAVGEVIIDVAVRDDVSAAHGRTYVMAITDKRNAAASARIMLSSGSFPVLLHELGHLWFTGHVDREGHVNSPRVPIDDFDRLVDGDRFWRGVREAFKAVKP